MKLLYIVPYAPTLIRPRPHHLLRGLARRGHHVTLATLWETEADREALGCLAQAGIRLWAHPLTRRQVVPNALRALMTGLPIQARYSWQPRLAAQVAAGLVDESFDLVHVEHLRGALYGRLAQRQLAGRGRSTPVVWDSVDCISLLFELASMNSRSVFGRWVTRLELPRTRAFEQAMLRQFAGVLVSAAKDQAALETLARGPRPGVRPVSIRLLPNGVDTDYFAPAEEPGDPEQVILSGKMSYHANITAALHLVNDIMPLVWQRRPQVRVVIAGSAPTAAVRALATARDTRVHVTGYVPDLRPSLRAAGVAVAPIRYGVGIQNKVLEAMASGLPVVCSPQACSALATVPGQDLLVASSPAEFAEAILSLIEKPALRDKLREAGRTYVSTHHSWDSIAGQLERYHYEWAGPSDEIARASSPIGVGL